MLIDAHAISQLIPHAGEMSLLDQVYSWDQHSIACLSTSHRKDANPFIESAGDTMNSAILVEYGAQAAAVHAALVQEGMAGQGTAYIGAIKNLTFNDKVVSRNIETLHINAQCELNTSEGAIYTIECGSQEKIIVTARIVLVLPGGE